MKIRSILFLVAVLCLFAVTNYSNAQHKVIEGATVTSGIKLVWDVKTNTWEDGIGAGFRYPHIWIEKYQSMGITGNDYLVSVVVHDKAGYWLLNDESYKAHTNTNDDNPNKEIVRELLEKGISVEICGVMMAEKKWSADNLLPGVTILEKGAYVRITDLEMQGYAYIVL